MSSFTMFAGWTLVTAFGVVILLMSFSAQPAEATTTTFSSDTTLSGDISIASGDTWIINSGVTVSGADVIRNSGNIINNGNFFTFDLDNHASGVVNNNKTFGSGGGTSNAGTINNNLGGTMGLLVVNSPTGIINNYGYTNLHIYYNEGKINNYSGGTIFSSSQFINLGNISNAGTFVNDYVSVINNNYGASITNTGTLNNVFGGSPTDSAVINNNYGATFTTSGTINNDGSINIKCGSNFDNTGIINGNSVNIESPCYTLSLFEGTQFSDRILNLNQEVTARAETDDGSINYVTFHWKNPIGDTIKTELIPLSLTGQANDKFMPNEAGRWTVEAEFKNGIVVQQTLDVPFTVLPESAIGLLGLIGSSLAALGGFFFLKKKNNSNTPHSVSDLGI